MKRTTLYMGLFAMLLIVLAAPAAVAQAAGGSDGQAEPSLSDEPDVVMHVKGLACSMCARSVTNELKKIDAVGEVEVLLEEDQRILIDLKEKVDEETLRAAVEAAGFSTRKVVFSSAPAEGSS